MVPQDTVKSLLRQLINIICQSFSGFKGLPLYLYIGFTLLKSQSSGTMSESHIIILNNFSYRVRKIGVAALPTVRFLS